MLSRQSAAVLERTDVVADSTAAPSSDADDALRLPPVQSIGRYRLDRGIAVGGMGSVHFGILTGAGDFSRVVAIKRLHPQLAGDPLFVARFREEARLTARVLHPNVVQLLDVVESNQELWLVMEYVDGETLRSLQTEALSAGRQLPLGVVAGVLSQVLHGLHAAHESTDDAGRALGIVHRDVSPQNILISRHGQVKVIDFGIAKAIGQLCLTGAGGLAGKVSYMSPEQVGGQKLDARADVFAAGIVLWEALTGARLFRATKQTEASVLRDILKKPVPAPSHLRPKVPKALDEVVLRALQRSPADRFQTAREFALALEAALPPTAASSIGACLTLLCEGRLARRQGTLSGVRNGGLPGATAIANDDEAEELTRLVVIESPRQNPERALGGGASAARARSLALPALVLTGMLTLGWEWRTFGARPEPSLDVSSAIVARPAKTPAPDPSPRHALVEAPSDPPRAELEALSVERLPVLPTKPGSRSPRRYQLAPAKPLPSPLTVDCANPTYLGDDQIRHFKKECL